VPTSPLHINGSSSIVSCVFVAAGMSLPSRYLEMDVCSGSTIPAFRRHVKISFSSPERPDRIWAHQASYPKGNGDCSPALYGRVLDLMIEFIGPLHNWLQQFTNHYLTHCHLPTAHSTGTILTLTELRMDSVVLPRTPSVLLTVSSYINGSLHG
jgi:hypothetical protein